MKIKQLTLSDETEMPESITVEMTIEEAVWLADHLGSMKSPPVWSDPIYGALVGGVINRYWEDGVDEAKKEVLK